MRIESEIINEFEKMIVQMNNNSNEENLTEEKKAYNEGILDSFSKINSIIDNHDMKVEDGYTEVTVGWMGGTNRVSFETVSDAVKELSEDYTADVFAVDVPTLPVSVVFEMEMAKDNGLYIWQLFDKAKKQRDESWAQWTLANSDLIAAAWTTERFDIE